MTRTLEVFVRKTGLCLIVKKISVETREFPQTNGVFGEASSKIREKWEYELLPPYIGRRIRVEKKNGYVTLFAVTGSTNKEARDRLLGIIRGTTLAYSNHFDRQCGDDEKIRVPKTLR